MRQIQHANAQAPNFAQPDPVHLPRKCEIMETAWKLADACQQYLDESLNQGHSATGARQDNRALTIETRDREGIDRYD